MNYLTLREASEVTGLTEATIRRLCKRPESKPYVQMKQGKKGPVYTVQADYLFGIYPLSKADKNSINILANYLSKEFSDSPKESVLLAAEEMIQHLKSEMSYLRDENIRLREENQALKRSSTSLNNPPKSWNIRHQAKVFFLKILGKK